MSDLKRVNIDLPDYVHDELSMLPGCKKPNAERLLIIWAKKQIKQRESAELKLNKG